MLLFNFYTNILVNSIIDIYFNDHRCLLIFTDEHLQYKGDIPVVRLRLRNGSVDYKLIFNYYGCQGVIIYSENPTTVFIQFENQIRHNMERFNRRRFLIVSRIRSEIFERNFFNFKELDFVTDLLLVLPQEENEESLVYQLQTHKYVGTSVDRKPLLLDFWFSKNQSFLYGANLYPDKLTNQLGRPLKMAVFPYEPYSIIGQSVDEYHGSELRSGVEFALKYNMSPVPVVNDKDYWGEIFVNWSGNGLLGNIAVDNADIGFSALYTWEYCYHYLDLSKPLVRTGITCLVPAPRLAARWLTPLFSYSSQLWFCVVALFAVSIVILSLILRFYNRNRTMILKYRGQPGRNNINFVQAASEIVLKPMLLQALSSNEAPNHLSSKFMTGLMFIFGLFLTSTYSSGLATVMTLPRYEDAIDTLEDFAKSGLDWGATQEAWITSIENATEPIYVKIVSKFHSSTEDTLRELSKTGKFGFSIERLPFENYAIGDYIREDVVGNFHVMQQDLYWEQCVMMMRKNSVLLPMLDLFILRIFEAGLISKWQNNAVSLYMNAYVQRAVRFYKHVQEHNVVKLNWSHVEGAFAILVVGYCVSFLVLAAEIAVDRKKLVQVVS